MNLDTGFKENSYNNFSSDEFEDAIALARNSGVKNMVGTLSTQLSDLSNPGHREWLNKDLLALQDAKFDDGATPAQKDAVIDYICFSAVYKVYFEGTGNITFLDTTILKAANRIITYMNFTKGEKITPLFSSKQVILAQLPELQKVILNNLDV